MAFNPYKWTCQCGKTGQAPNKETAHARMEMHWRRRNEHTGKASGSVGPR